MALQIFRAAATLSAAEDLLEFSAINAERLGILLKYLYSLPAHEPAYAEDEILYACNPDLPALSLEELQSSMERDSMDRVDFYIAVSHLIAAKKIARIGTRPALYHRSAVIAERLAAIRRFYEAHPYEVFTVEETRNELGLARDRLTETAVYLEELAEQDVRFHSEIDDERSGRTQYQFILSGMTAPPATPTLGLKFKDWDNAILRVLGREEPLTRVQIRRRLNVSRYAQELFSIKLQALVRQGRLIKETRAEQDDLYRMGSRNGNTEKEPESHPMLNDAVSHFVREGSELDYLRAGIANPVHRMGLVRNILDRSLVDVLMGIPEALLRTTDPRVRQRALEMVQGADRAILTSWLTAALGENPVIPTIAEALWSIRHSVKTFDAFLYWTHLIRPADVLALADHLYAQAAMALAHETLPTAKPLREHA